MADLGLRLAYAKLKEAGPSYSLESSRAGETTLALQFHRCRHADKIFICGPQKDEIRVTPEAPRRKVTTHTNRSRSSRKEMRGYKQVAIPGLLVSPAPQWVVGTIHELRHRKRTVPRKSGTIPHP